MADLDVDLFVIGAGSGGVRAARIAAGYGAKVAIAEEYRVGGTCVIRGCVPKKLMVYASRFREEFEDAAGFGWEVGEPRFDWAKLKANRDAEIARLERIYNSLLQGSKVETFAERAVIEDANTVRLVKSGRTVRAGHILVAVGAHPTLEPPIPGGELAITSNEVFELEELPPRILVVGGGYIAVEFAGVFHGLGSRTSLLHRGDKLLRGFDEDVRDALGKAYAERGIDLALGVTIERMDRRGDCIAVMLSDGRVIEADQVLVATGRRPNTKGLGLENVGIELDRVGAIPVDGYSRTIAPTISAVGDVTNRANLTPVAIREGHAFADTVFGGKPTLVEHDLIPTAVFSTPEIGTVGHGEEAARRLYGDGNIIIYKASFRPMKATLSGRNEQVLMKLVVQAETDKVLGVHIVGEHAGEMIQLAGVAMSMGATKADFDRTVAVHPTAAEELVTMRTPFVTKHPVAVG
jgi:glutathione reductase (NADPH)